MNAYEKSVELGLEGTSAEKVAVLKTLTVSDIPVESVATWLREHQLWYRSGPTSMAGTLQAIVENEQVPQPVKDGLGVLYSAVFGRGAATLRTTDAHWAVVVSQILASVASVNPALAELEDSFYALDGGRPYKDVTVEVFEQQQTDAVEADERQAIIDACIAPIAEAQAAAAARLNNAYASLGEEHVSGLSLVELQARCDAVTASEDGVIV